MLNTIARSVLPFALFSLSATGCVVVTDDPVGILTLDWSIGLDLAARDCLLTQSDRLELILEDEFGGLQEVEANCENFSLSIDLEEGLYFPEITLVDSFDNATSDTLLLESVYVFGDEEVIISADFRLSDFF